jgi:choline kinase
MPKCLVRVAGRRIIEWQLELLNEVPDVRVVVGFLEDEVIECVRAVRSDVIFVRNPHYASTSTLQSIALATRNLKQPFLILDGDLLIERHSFASFLDACEADTPLIALAPAHSEDAVYVTTREDSRGTLWATGFQREPRTAMEWTGVAYLDGSFIENRNCYVYERIAPRLPVRAAVIQALEIDTSADLERANSALGAGGWRSILDDRPPTTDHRDSANDGGRWSVVSRQLPSDGR